MTQQTLHTSSQQLKTGLQQQVLLHRTAQPSRVHRNRLCCYALASRNNKTAAAAAAAAPEAPTVNPTREVNTPKPINSVLTSSELLRLFQLPDAAPSFAEAEAQFVKLLQTENLDQALRGNEILQGSARSVEAAVQKACNIAYLEQADDVQAGGAAHLFLQRILYRINRMVLFWYDDLSNYSNERSYWLAQLRDTIEGPWQAWELAQMDVDVYKAMTPDQLKEALRQRYTEDVNPPVSEPARYMREEMTREGYRHLLAMTSVDGLVEASRQSRVCGGAANEIMCAVFRVLMEEYGTGRFNRKHSTFFAKMMDELDLSTEPEFFFDAVPWQSLASINHNFLLTERRRHYLRYLGGLTFFEIAGPAIYTTYLKAAQRIGLSDGASGYWELHIKEDERHGRQMVEDVAVPLVDQYADDHAWEVLLGYDQEKLMGNRAGAAAVEAIKIVDQQQRSPFFE
jgi:hypothetical protein